MKSLESIGCRRLLATPQDVLIQRRVAISWRRKIDELRPKKRAIFSSPMAFSLFGAADRGLFLKGIKRQPLKLHWTRFTAALAE
jgi:hypothetical protein